MKKFCALLLVLGLLTVCFSQAVVYMVQNNESLLAVKKYVDFTLEPDSVDALLALADSPLVRNFIGYQLDDTSRTGLQIYSLTPEITLIGSVLCAVGGLGLVITLLLRGKRS